MSTKTRRARAKNPDGTGYPVHLNSPTNATGLYYITPGAAAQIYGISIDRINILMELDIIVSNKDVDYGSRLIVEGSLREYIERSLALGRLP